MAATNLAPIRRKLLGWYEKNKRDLPWRRTSDPYAIWISETMLQQTQVKTVLPYYAPFLQNLPTVQALDRAPLRRVLQLWSGLGYYRRAENLKKAARQIVRQHGGALPADYGQLRALAGIGEYTAGALLSIAFEKRYAAIDGNVRRVLSRLLNPIGTNALRESARQLVPQSKPGRFNQALMELGATICLPGEPRCRLCPLAGHCHSHKKNRMAGHPAPRRKRNFKNVTWPLAIVRCDGKILLRRRSDSGLLAGLWEIPGGEQRARESVLETIGRNLEELGLSRHSACALDEIRHSITYRRIRAPIFLIEVGVKDSIELPDRAWRWIAPAALHRYPVSSMTRKAAAALAAHEKNFS